jgi:3-dehydroquinate synthase
MGRLLIGGHTEILIGPGWPDPLLPPRSDREKAVVITQPGAAAVAARVAADLGAPLLEVADREQAKTMASLNTVYEWLGEEGVGRHDTIVAVGGGAVTDLGGFAAATWLRGIEVVHLPTTLLAAVDAAIGGKTGINLAGKNLVGAFHHPSRVVIDLDTLAALPTPIRLEGIAEALKAGLVGDSRLVDLFASQGVEADLEEVVTRAVAVKVEIAGSDPRDEGRRMVLNFGHTIGHAVEFTAGLSHGPAISVGMVAAGSISAQRYGFPAAWLTDLIFSLGLPVAVSDLSGQVIVDLIGRDKKRTARGVRMVLLQAVGAPVVEVVAADELGHGLAAVGIG